MVVFIVVVTDVMIISFTILLYLFFAVVDSDNNDSTVVGVDVFLLDINCIQHNVEYFIQIKQKQILPYSSILSMNILFQRRVKGFSNYNYFKAKNNNF